MGEVKKIQYVQTFQNPGTRYVHYNDHLTRSARTISHG